MMKLSLTVMVACLAMARAAAQTPIDWPALTHQMSAQRKRRILAEPRRFLQRLQAVRAMTVQSRALFLPLIRRGDRLAVALKQWAQAEVLHQVLTGRELRL